MFLLVCPNLLSIKFSKSTLKRDLSNNLATFFATSVFPLPGKPSNKNLLIPTLWFTALIIPFMSSVISSGKFNASKFFVSTCFKNSLSKSLLCGEYKFDSDINPIIYSDN